MNPNEIIVRRDGWNDVENEFFMDRYNLYKDEVGKNKEFKTRKAMFSCIAGEMSKFSNKSEQQLTTRFYTLTRKNKKQGLIKSVVKNDELSVARASVVAIKPEMIVDMNQVTFVDMNGIPLMATEELLVETNETSDADENETIIINDDESDEVVGTDENEMSTINDDASDEVVGTDENEISIVNGNNSTEVIVADATEAQKATGYGILSGINPHHSTFPRFGGPSRSIASTNVGIATVYTAPMINRMFSNINDAAPTCASTSGSSICAPTVRISGAFSLSNPTRMSTSLNATSSSATPLRSAPQNSAIAKKSVTWTVEETKWVLDQYYLNMDEVGPMKRYRTKNAMWKSLASKMAKEFEEIKTGEQLSKRVAEVIEQKKATIGRNRISGAVRELVEYEEEIDKITALDDSIEPDVMRSSDGKVRYKEDKERTIKKPRWDKPNKKGILNSLAETMSSAEMRKKEREEIKEKRREETHNVLLEYLRSLKKPEH